MASFDAGMSEATTNFSPLQMEGVKVFPLAKKGWK
jgi:hypothetical protein